MRYLSIMNSFEILRFCLWLFCSTRDQYRLRVSHGPYLTISIIGAKSLIVYKSQMKAGSGSECTFQEKRNIPA